MKINILIILSCLILISNAFADPPSSASYTLVQRGFLTGNANQASPPGSASYELTETSITGIANDAEISTEYVHYPGFLQLTNDAPTIILPDDFTFEEDDGLVVDFAPFINDINGDIVALSVSGNSNVMVNIQNFVVTFSAVPDWNGMETLTFTANDNMDRAVASDNVDIIVTPVNDDPTIFLPDDFTFDEDDDLVVDFSDFVEDIDLDVLTLTVEGNSEIDVDIVGLVVIFSATENWNGSEILTFTVDDGQGERVSFTVGKNNTEKNDHSRATAEDDVEVIVAAVNDEPILIGFLPPDLEFMVVEDSTVTFSVDVEDIDSTIDYEWFVDGSLQTESTEEFVHIFEVVGNVEIKSIASDEEYDIETIWAVQVEEGSAVEDILPVSTALSQNFPNPFNPTTTISYSLLDAGKVRIEIFNIKGEKIRTLVNEHKNVGNHSTVWNGKDNSGKSVASGMYFYNMVTDNYYKIRKMLLIK